MRTVLIVDDEYGIAEIVGDVLSSHGFTVHTAINGRLAMASLSQTVPDLILLDVMMPVMTGPEMLHALKRNELYRHIPVIMMSAVGISALTAQEMSMVEAFLSKPFTYEELMAALRTALEAEIPSA